MSEETQAEIKPEQFERVTKERDEARQKTQELEEQLVASRKISQAERFLRVQNVPEEEIPGRLDLLGPHLAGITPEQLDDTLASDRFKPLVMAAVTSEGEGEGGEQPPETPPGTPAPPTGFAGPSPAGNEPPPAEKRYTLKSPEVQDIIRRNDKEALEKLYKDNLIDPPVRNY